jgi:predicted SAM-dependent methyltransferase
MRIFEAFGLQFVARKVRELIQEIAIWFVHLAGCVRAGRYRQARGVKLQFGCGPKAKPGWLNVDLFGNPDVRLDLRRPMPFADGFAAQVYSEHFLEHLDYPWTVRHFLAECSRLLEPGGRIRIGVPDAEHPLKNYAPGKAIEPWPGHPDWLRSNLDQLDFLFRMNNLEHWDEHRHAWDFETLAIRLQEAGFREVTLSQYQPELDSEDRRWGTLYVEAVKPVG